VEYKEGDIDWGFRHGGRTGALLPANGGEEARAIKRSFVSHDGRTRVPR
jgi:hypothetical protein